MLAPLNELNYTENDGSGIDLNNGKDHVAGSVQMITRNKIYDTRVFGGLMEGSFCWGLLPMVPALKLIFHLTGSCNRSQPLNLE